ncbi:MAG: hypothetical protein AB8G05_19510 [Oligoflexales bacterium]
MSAAKIMPTILLFGLYACTGNQESPGDSGNVENVDSNSIENAKIVDLQKTRNHTINKEIDPGFMLTAEEEICVVSYPSLRAENIRAGVTIAGVVGTAEVTPLCSETLTTNCVTTAAFPAVDTQGLAAKVVSGQTVAGTAGTAIQAKDDCTAANQTDCIATSTYKTIDLSSKDAGGALDITGSNFESRAASASTFEYWDENGNRHTNTGDADLTSNNLKSGVNILGTDGTTDPLNCASISSGTWISVPGDPDYGTNDFCVMKYEAKNNGSNEPTSTVANAPWGSIDFYDAKTECASLGKGFHLMTNDEWMTITANVANVDSNWSGGSVGSGNLYRGHSDNDPSAACPADADDSKGFVEGTCTAQAAGGTEGSEGTQRRTMSLSNGQVIWDLSGNVRQWIDYFNDGEKPTPNDGAYNEFNLPIAGTTTMPLSDLIPTNAVKSFWVNSWNSDQGVGKGRNGVDDDGGALTRGGGYTGGDKNGIFRYRLDQGPAAKYTTLGFRCAITRP